MDIAAFIFRLGEANPGRRFRLPTEAEWEYACRAARQQEMFGGKAPRAAPIRPNTPTGTARAPAGGRLPPNKLGLHDMSGNLWSGFPASYSPVPPAPTAATAAPCRRQLARHCCVAAAGRTIPASRVAASGTCTAGRRRFDFVGFRLVLDSSNRRWPACASRFPPSAAGSRPASTSAAGELNNFAASPAGRVISNCPAARAGLAVLGKGVGSQHAMIGSVPVAWRGCGGRPSVHLRHGTSISSRS